MPTLINGGPNIPAELLNAHANGEVVFFCGAGVSIDAGLPGFRKLVEKVVRPKDFEETDLIREFWKKEQYDKVLDEYDKRTVSVTMREGIARELDTTKITDLTLHRALIELSITIDGECRLVTTNADDLFVRASEKAGFQKEINDVAPKLPVPAKERWKSIVHVHGLLDYDNPGEGETVFTTSEFGRAYLTEGWANRFVNELFRNYQVVFAGYSVDDPVMRYMVDAVLSETERRAGYSKPHAFVPISETNAEMARLEWKAKNVVPIEYDKSGRHKKLGDTIVEWARIHKKGLNAKCEIVCALGKQVPGGLSGEELERVVWLISDSSGAVAREFANIDPPAPIEWLVSFEKEGLFNLPTQENKRQKGVERQTRSPLFLERSYSGDDNRLPQVTLQLVHWMGKHLEDRRLFSWLVRQDGRLHKDAASILRDALGKTGLSDKTRAYWRLALRGKHAGVERPNMRVSEVVKYLGTHSVDFDLIDEIFAHLRPVYNFRGHADLMEVWPETDTARIESGLRDFLRGENIVSDVKLYAGRATDHLADTLLKSEMCDELLLALVWKLNLHLAEVMEMIAFHENVNPTQVRSAHLKSSISSPVKEWNLDDWTHLIPLVWNSFLAVARLKPERLPVLLAFWRSQPYPLHRRLILRGCAESEKVGVQIALKLIEDEPDVIWDDEYRQEILYFLMKLDERVSAEHIESLASSVLEGPSQGPPAWLESEAAAKQWAEEMILTRLVAIRDSEMELPQDAQKTLDELVERYGEPPDTAEVLKDRERGAEAYWAPIGERAVVGLKDVTPEELVGVLADEKHDLQSDAIQGLGEILRSEEIEFAMAVATGLHAGGEWKARLWGSLASRLAEIEDDSALRQSFAPFAELLKDAPDAVFREATRDIAGWLHYQAKVINVEDEHLYWPLWDRAWEHAKSMEDHYEDDKDVIFRAINHPCGILAWGILFRMTASPAKPGDGIPEALARRVQEIAEGITQQLLMAKVVVLSRLIHIFSLDPVFTEKHLLPLLDMGSNDDAETHWIGYLWTAQVNSALLRAYKESFLKAFTSIWEMPSEYMRNFCSLFALVSVHDMQEIGEDEIRSVLRGTSKKSLQMIARHWQRILDAAGDGREELWQKKIGPLLEECWPKEGREEDSFTSEALAELVCHTGDAFPEAVELVLPFLTLCGTNVFMDIQRTGVHKDYPRETLKLLRKLHGRGPSEAYGLEELLNEIKDVWPEGEEGPDLRHFE